MNTIKYLAVSLALAMSMMMIGGCKTDQPGVTNTAGTIKATLAANPAAVTEAAKEVVNKMELVLISANSTSIDGRVVARTAQDVKVKIDSEKVGEGVSDVSIRVGTLGDKELGMTILSEIKAKLGIPAASTEEKAAEDVGAMPQQ